MNVIGILFGLYILGYGIFLILRSIRLRSKGVFAIGTVKEVRITQRAPNIFVSFETLHGRTVVFKAGGWSGINTSPFYQVGNPVPVLYDPKDPTNAVVYSFDFMWVLPLLITGIGFIFVYLGLAH